MRSRNRVGIGSSEKPNSAPYELRVWLFTAANGANADRASDAIAHQRGSQSWSKGHSIRRPRRGHKFQGGSKTRRQPVSSREWPTETILALVGKLVARAVAKHLRMDLKGKLRRLPSVARAMCVPWPRLTTNSVGYTEPGGESGVGQLVISAAPHAMALVTSPELFSAAECGHRQPPYPPTMQARCSGLA